MFEEVSIVIPAYNAADWLEGTTEHIEVSLKTCGIKKAEIIIVNDGSTDDTSGIAHKLHRAYPVVVVDNENQGRYLARKSGVSKAKYKNLLFIDTRVFLHKDALKFISDQLKEHPDRQVWNGHVLVSKQGNIIARFGDAITYIGWRRYFGNPRTCSYGVDDFDYYPKGTGCFLVPKDTLLNAMKKFESQTFDIRNSSDDTNLIRIIASKSRINLSPSFSCIYFSRSKLSQFLKHSFNRGKFFVDGFLRRGTRFFYPLILFLIVTPLMLALCIVHPSLVGYIFMLALSVWVLELLVALMLRVPVADALSLFALTPIFSVTYGLGIWSAVINRIRGLL